MGRRQFKQYSKQIADELHTRIQQELTSQFKGTLLQSIKNILEIELRKDPTVAAITTNSELVGQLGLTNSANKMDAIVKKILDLLKVQSNTNINLKTAKSGRLYLSITLLLDNQKATSYGPLFINEAFQQVAPTKRRPLNLPLPWLEWILLSGATFVVTDAGTFQSPKNIKFSRSGQDFLMRPNGRFRIPAHHQGTADNNFITRSSEKSLNQIKNLIADKSLMIIKRIVKRR